VHKVGNKIECNNMHGERIKSVNVELFNVKPGGTKSNQWEFDIQRTVHRDVFL